MTEQRLYDLASRITNEKARENWLNFMRSVELSAPAQIRVERPDIDGIQAIKASEIRELERSRLVAVEQKVDNPFDADEQLVENVGVNAQDKYGKTALHDAVMDGDIELVRSLLSEGADKTITDHAGDTAADKAAQLGEIEILNLLK